MNCIPVFDLHRAIESLASEVETGWHRLLHDSAFIGGEEVTVFENAFASFLGAGGCVGVANGTDALELALRALQLPEGGEVVVPSFTFIATAASVVLAGGRPVFVDVEPGTLNVDPGAVEAAISDRTVGVIGVHLYGRPFAVERLRSLCERHGLWLIEDAAQAHGATWEETCVGNFGDLATWSFYPSKNLGCFGDGGAITGNASDLLERVRRLANHGRQEHYIHSRVGRNSRLDGLQAVVLNRRLPTLAQDNDRRRSIARSYREGLVDLEKIELLVDSPEATPVYHQFTILTDRRDHLKSYLDAQGIGTSVHYPLALHLQPAFAGFVPSPGELPVAGAAGDRVLCLPMFPQLEDQEVERVISAIRRWAESG